MICAPPGKAAFNVNGATLHSVFHLPVNQLIGPLVPLSSDVLNTIRCQMEHVKLLIIDEISMVGGKMFNFINLRLQQIYNNDLVFGGLPILVLGDSRQLPPAGDSYIFKTTDKCTNYADIVDDYLWSNFKYIELSEIMRQKDDKLFAEALNNMANETMTRDDVKIFENRYIGKEFDDDVIPREAICLLRTNKAVQTFNEDA